VLISTAVAFSRCAHKIAETEIAVKANLVLSYFDAAFRPWVFIFTQ